MKFDFRGLMAPVLTPFTSDGTYSLVLGVIPQYAQYLLENDVNAVLVNGTSGEGPSLNLQERKSVAEAWADAVKQTKQVLMVQVGGAPFPDVKELARHAEEIGAKALLCLPELYFRPTTVQELVSYLRQISEAAPHTPLFYYHIPMLTGVNINMPKFMEIAAAQIPTFAGAKYTNSNLEEGTQCLKVKDGELNVFLGNDYILAGAFVQGFDSAIATSLNMFPGPTQRMLSAVKNSNIPAVCAEQRDLTEAINVITRNASWVVSMKAAMNLVTPIKVGPPRPPLQPLTQAQLKEMEEELIRFHF